MTHFETQYGSSKAAYWAFSAYDKYTQPTVSAAIEITIKGWQKAKRQIVSPDGVPINFDVTCIALQAIAPGSIIRKGKLVDVPSTPNNLYEVQDCTEDDDIKGCNTVYQLRLIKRASLPTLAS